MLEPVPEKPTKSRAGAGGNHRKNSPAYKAMVAEQIAALGGDVQPEDAPVIPIKTPRRPVWLTDSLARIVWDDLVPDLVESGRIASADASLIATYCMDVAVYMASMERQKRLDPSVTDERQRRILDQADKAQKRIMLMAEHLGIGVKSRAAATRAANMAAPQAAAVPQKPADEQKKKLQDFVQFG